MNDYNSISCYIDDRVKDGEVRMLVSDFAILWNQYERALYKGEHHIRDIENKLHSYSEIMDIDKLDKLYNRFCEYLKYRDISFDYKGIKTAYNIRIKDDCYNKRGDLYRKQLECAITDNSSFSRAYLLLIIIAKVRNNMFHGNKGAWELKEQKELFKICNEMLMSVLEITKLKDF